VAVNQNKPPTRLSRRERQKIRQRRDGIEKDRFKAIADPYLLAAALDGITAAFLFLWLEEPERHPFPEDPDVILNIILKGLIGP